MATIKILDILSMMLITTGVTSTVMLVMIKYSLFDFYRERKFKWMPDFCLICVCFWLCWSTAVAMNYSLALGLSLTQLIIISLGSTSFTWRITSV